MMKNVYSVPNHVGNSIKKRKLNAKNGIKFGIIIFFIPFITKMEYGTDTNFTFTNGHASCKIENGV